MWPHCSISKNHFDSTNTHRSPLVTNQPKFIPSEVIYTFYHVSTTQKHLIAHYASHSNELRWCVCVCGWTKTTPTQPHRHTCVLHTTTQLLQPIQLPAHRSTSFYRTHRHRRVEHRARVRTHKPLNSIAQATSGLGEIVHFRSVAKSSQIEHTIPILFIVVVRQLLSLPTKKRQEIIERTRCFSVGFTALVRRHNSWIPSILLHQNRNRKIVVFSARQSSQLFLHGWQVHKWQKELTRNDTKLRKKNASRQ